MVFCGYSTGFYHISSFLIFKLFKPARFGDGAHIDVPIHRPFFLFSISLFYINRHASIDRSPSTGG
jgi:hypothetical protein